MSGFLENLVDILLFSPCIEQAELAENPLLEGNGALLPFFFEGFDGVYTLISQYVILNWMKDLKSASGCIQILRFALNDRGKRVRLNDSGSVLNGKVKRRNPCFLFLEIAIRIEQIVHWGNKVVVAVAACQIAGKSSGEADFPYGILYH